MKQSSSLHRAFIDAPSLLILVSLSVTSVLVVAVLLGAFDRFADDGQVNKPIVVSSLIIYWLLFFLIAWAIPMAIRYPKNALLFIGSVTVALAMAEISCRILLPSTAALKFRGISSRQFHHLYPPETRMYMGNFDGEDVYLETNEDGLRTRHSRDVFRGYQERVIVLGDSFTLGFGLKSEKSFPERLEAGLRKSHPTKSVAVLNAGVLSYSPLLERLLFQERLVDYEPTLVLLFLDATDFGDDYQYMNESKQLDGQTIFERNDATPEVYRGALYELVRPYRGLFNSSLYYPLEVVRRAWLRDRHEPKPKKDESAYEYYEFRIKIGETVEKNRFFIYRHPLELTRQYLDITLQNVDLIADLAKSIGARFALFVTPRFHHWNVREAPDNWERAQYALNEPFQFEYFRYFETMSRERAYPVIDLLPDFQSTDEFPLVFRDDPHWNAAGHAFVANAVMRHIARSGLMATSSSRTQPSL